MAISLFPYGPKLSAEALQDGDLQFAVNQVITLLDCSHPDWWTGSLGDRSGPFPSSFVSRECLGTATVTHSYEPQREDELGLHVGDRVSVYEKRANGWWRVIYKHQRGGLFPSSHLRLHGADEPVTPREGPLSPRVRPKKKKKSTRSKRDRSSVSRVQGLEDQALRDQLTRSAPMVRRESPRTHSLQISSPREKSPTAPTSTPLAKARVVRGYQANHPGDLTITEGSLIFLTKSRGPWWEGVDKTGARGIFPAKCVEKVEAAAAATKG